MTLRDVVGWPRQARPYVDALLRRPPRLLS
jgi:hypothetical protein